MTGSGNPMYGKTRLYNILRCESKEYRDKLSRALKGHIVTESTRLKIGKANKGRKPPEHVLKMLRTSFLGKKHSVETRTKMAEAQRGDKGHRWKGGVSSRSKTLHGSFLWKDWRKEVFERDGYMCQICGYVYKYDKPEKRNLHPHHIFHVSKLINTDYEKHIFNAANGLTLCVPCHRNLHYAKI